MASAERSGICRRIPAWGGGDSRLKLIPASSPTGAGSSNRGLSALCPLLAALPQGSFCVPQPRALPGAALCWPQLTVRCELLLKRDFQRDSKRDSKSSSLQQVVKRYGPSPKPCKRLSFPMRLSWIYCWSSQEFNAEG